MLTRHVPASYPRAREGGQESSGKTGEEHFRATTLIGLSTTWRLSTPPQPPRTLSLTKFLPVLSLEEGSVTSLAIANLCVRRPPGLGAPRAALENALALLFHLLRTRARACEEDARRWGGDPQNFQKTFAR
ncbi:hypothetical protein HPB50_002052 [Hyalomma asiaticum]|uniref:Uncharacterized protein n=1 Tax=Hyalomma asiaticum TaxID=266040 RepID=A0ACB7T9I1_HYAAI|nr:hypothetical protein HPB50_002052 [Hyalomma asiaticum]